MSQQESIEKVIFMIDRRDLDTQSIKNFNSYLSDANQIDMTDSSFKLVKQLNSNDSKLIVTTIQKMSNIKEENDGLNEKDIETIDQLYCCGWPHCGIDWMHKGKHSPV